MTPSNRSAATDHAHPLTRRELEILDLLATGESTAAIAERLGIAPATVKSHLTQVYRKLRVKNRVQAARHYLDHYADPGEPRATAEP